MQDIQKLMQLLSDIDFMEDFVKVSAMDFKIDKHVANEILRLITEMKTRSLK